MGKIIVFSLLVIFALTTACFGDDVAQQEYHVNIRNTTGGALASIIPITTIRPKIDKLVGYVAMPINNGTNADGDKINTETFVALFDGTSVAMSGECFGEEEARGSESVGERWARGRWIVNGVVVWQGANTDMNIYFIRR